MSDSEEEDVVAAPSRNGGQVPQRSKILVAVRVRPLLPKEVTSGHCRIIKVMGERLVILREKKGFARRTSAGNALVNLKSRKPREKKYVFDHAFADDTSQHSLYNITTAGLVDSVLEGYNGTVFAYGATGSGKTYTMIGNEQEPGTMYLALKDLLRKTAAARDDRALKFKLTLSYLEIYNELIRDLMKPEQPPLELREHPDKGMRVTGITEFEVENIQEIMDLLLIGNENRTTEPTEANDQSSRSHAVLQILIEQQDTSRNQIKTAKLNLIDLAGSERGCVSQNRGVRLLEGGNINRSLLALGNCINALASDPKEKRGTFVPYRDSKLTRLLKDSLGGNCNTVMITTVSPSHTAMEESTNTLKYATRAKKIKNNVVCNERTVSYHVSRYEAVIEDLQNQVASLRGKLEQQAQHAVRAPVADSAVRKEYELLKRSILFNFNEQRRVRKQMADVHELQLQLFLNISTAQAQADERQVLGDYGCGSDAATQRVIDDATRKIRKNEKLRAALKEKVMSLEAESRQFSARIHGSDGGKGIACKEIRELLAQDLSMRQLELDYLDLEGRKDMQEQLVENKNVLMRRLRLHVSLRDAVIKQQRSVLEQHGISQEALQDGYSMITTLERDPQASSSLPAGSLPPIGNGSAVGGMAGGTGRGGMPHAANSATVSSFRNYQAQGGLGGGLPPVAAARQVAAAASSSHPRDHGGARGGKTPSVAALSAALQNRRHNVDGAGAAGGKTHPRQPASGHAAHERARNPSPVPKITPGTSGAALRGNRVKHPTRPGYSSHTDLGIKALGSGLAAKGAAFGNKHRQHVR